MGDKADLRSTSPWDLDGQLKVKFAKPLLNSFGGMRICSQLVNGSAVVSTRSNFVKLQPILFCGGQLCESPAHMILLHNVKFVKPRLNWFVGDKFVQNQTMCMSKPVQVHIC